MSIGHKGMMQASEALAITMVDLFEDAELRRAIRAEFDKTTGGHVYQPYIPPGPPPIPRIECCKLLMTSVQGLTSEPEIVMKQSRKPAGFAPPTRVMRTSDPGSAWIFVVSAKAW